jgi:hypothetical protein
MGFAQTWTGLTILWPVNASSEGVFACFWVLNIVVIDEPEAAETFAIMRRWF